MAQMLKYISLVDRSNQKAIFPLDPCSSENSKDVKENFHHLKNYLKNNVHVIITLYFKNQHLYGTSLCKQKQAISNKRLRKLYLTNRHLGDQMS